MDIEIIKQLCKENGTNIKRLEEALGIGNGVIARWKKSTPSSDKLAAVASYFGVTVDYLLSGQEPAGQDPEIDEYLEELRSRSEMRMLFKLAKNATKEEVEQTVRIIEALRKRE